MIEFVFMETHKLADIIDMQIKMVMFGVAIYVKKKIASIIHSIYPKNSFIRGH